MVFSMDFDSSSEATSGMSNHLDQIVNHLKDIEQHINTNMDDTVWQGGSKQSFIQNIHRYISDCNKYKETLHSYTHGFNQIQNNYMQADQAVSQFLQGS